MGKAVSALEESGWCLGRLHVYLGIPKWPPGDKRWMIGRRQCLRTEAPVPSGSGMVKEDLISSLGPPRRKCRTMAGQKTKRGP